MASSTRDLILRFQADTTELKRASSQAQKTTSGMASDISNSSKKGATGFKKGMGAMLGVASKVAGPLAAIFAVDKIKDFGVASVTAASDLQETLSKSSVIFGKQAKSMERWAEGGAKSFGLSKEAALGAATGFGDMLSQIGFTGKESAKASKGVVQMAADLGSFNNLETGEVLDMISASMRGEYDSLQRVIPNINAARVEKEALAATGKKVAKNLTAEEKAQATLAIIQKDGARAAGDFARTSGGLANQQKILKAQFDNLKATIGTALLPVLSKGAQLLNKVMGPATEAVGRGIKRMSEGFQRLKGGGANLGPIGSGLGKLADAAKGLWAVISPIIKQIGGKLFAGIKKNLPALQAMFGELAKTLGQAFTLIGMYYTKVAAVVKKVWSVIGPTVLSILGSIIDAVVGILGGLIKVISGIMTVIVGIFTGDGEKIKSGLTKIFSGLVQIIGSLLKLLWNVVKAIFGPLVSWLIKKVTSLKDGIVKRFKALITWVTGTWAKAWGKIKEFFTRPVIAAAKQLIKFVRMIREGLRLIGQWLSNTWRKSWAKIKGYFTAPVIAARNTISKFVAKIKSTFTTIKTWASTTWKKGWANLRAYITAPIKKGREDTAAAVDKIRAKFKGIKEWMRTTFQKSWSKVQGWILKPINAARDAIKKLFDKNGTVRGVFNKFITATGAIFAKMKAAIGKPINAVIKFINEGLLRGGINKILGALGVPKGEQIPWLKPLSYRRGGPIRGPGTGTSDDVLIKASNNEHMLTRQEVRKLGGHRRILAWRKAVRQGKAYDYPGYAGGGVVRPVPGGFGTFPSYAGHTGVDFPVGTGTPVHAVTAGVIKAVRSLTYSYGKHVIQSMAGSTMESLYAHLNSFTVRPGQNVGAGQIIGYSDSTGNSTGPHLHYTLQHPGGRYVDPTSFLNSGKIPGGTTGGGVTGAITDLLGFLKGLSPVKWLSTKATELQGKITSQLGKYPWARGLARIPGLLISKAKSYMEEKLFGGIGVAEPAGSGVARWRSTIVAALKANSLPTSDDYVNAWLRQVESESGGNPKAVQNGYVDVNTISGDLAKGLLQTISATFNAYKHPGHGDIFNGFDNALAAINYAKSRYGSQGMLGVIGHGHGYDSGGFLPPGVTVAVNRTGRPEPVLTGQQWDAITADPQPHTLNVHFHGVIDSSTAAREIETLLRNRQRGTTGVQLPPRTRPLRAGK